jgi:hypothetical protein
VPLHGALGEPDPARDLLVREARRDPDEDLALPDGQRIDAREPRPQPSAGAPSGDQPQQQRGRPVHEGPNGRGLTLASRGVG